MTARSAIWKATPWLTPIGRPNGLAGPWRRRWPRARLRQPDGERGDRDPAVVEGLQELLEARAALAGRAGGRPGRGSPRRTGRGCRRRASRACRRRADGEPGRAGRDHDRADLGRAVLVGPVRAVTVTTEVMSVPELVMKAFAPLTTHSSPSAARGRAGGTASEPASGSVSPRPRARARRRGRAASAPSAPRCRRSGSGWCRAPGVRRQGDRHRLVDPRQLLDRDRERESARRRTPRASPCR